MSDIERAAQARNLANDPAFLDAMKALRDTEAVRALGAPSPEEREEARLMVLAIGKVAQHLKGVITKGQVKEREIQEENERMAAAREAAAEEDAAKQLAQEGWERLAKAQRDRYEHEEPNHG